MEKQITINGKTLKVEFLFIGRGQNPKCFAFINGKRWVSINPYNVKTTPDFEMNMIIDELKFGAYKMFIK